MPDPIYKTKDGQQVTKEQLKQSGYSEERINKGVSNGILELIGDTNVGGQVFKSRDGQTVTYDDLIQSGYNEDRINKGIQNGILTAESSVKKKDGLSATGGVSVGGGTETFPSASGFPLSLESPKVDEGDPLTPLIAGNLKHRQDEKSLNNLVTVAGAQDEEDAFALGSIQQPEAGVLTEFIANQKKNRIQQKDPETIKQVVATQKEKIKSQRDRLIDERTQLVTSNNITGNVEAAAEALTTNPINQKIKELDSQEKELLNDAATVIVQKHTEDFLASPDHSDQAQEQFGDKIRADLNVIGADKSSYDLQKAEWEASKKYDWVRGRRLGLVPYKRYTDEDKTNQVFKFTNQNTLLQSVYNKQKADLEKTLASPVLNEFLQLGKQLDQQQKDGNMDAARQTALRMQALSEDPLIKTANKLQKDLGVTIEHLTNLPNKYPQVKVDIERDEFIDYFAKQFEKRGHLLPNDQAVQTIKDFFVGSKPTEQDIKDFAKLKGIDEKIVREYAGSYRIPSGLRSIVEAGGGVIQDIDKSMNRWKTNIGSQEEGVTEILNKDNANSPWKMPEALAAKNLSTLTTRNIMHTMTQGLGQMAAYVGLAEIGGELLGGLQKGLGAASRTIARPATANTEIISNLPQQLLKANDLGATYGVGYAQSYESAYKTAREYTSDESKAREFANADAFWNGISELILPDISIAKRALLQNNLRNSFVKLIQGKAPVDAATLFKRGALEMTKVMGLESVEELFPLAYETLAKNRLFDQDITFPQFLRQAYETVVQTAISAAPLGIGAIRGLPSSHITKASMYEAGLTPDIFKELNKAKFDQGKFTEAEYNKANKVVATMADIIPQIEKDNKGNDLSHEQKVELAHRMFNQRVLNEQAKVADESLQKGIEEDKKNNKTAIDAVLNGEPGDYAKQTAPPKTAIDILEKHKSTLPPVYQTMMYEKPEELLNQIVDQALNKVATHLSPSTDQAMKAANELFGPELVKEAIAFSNNKTNQDEKNTSTVLPTESQQGNVQTESTTEEGGSIPVGISKDTVSDERSTGGQEVSSIAATNVGAAEVSKGAEAVPTIKPVYHGTMNLFDQFDEGKMGSNTGAESAKEGFFFATNRVVAEGYGGSIESRLRDMEKRSTEAMNQIKELTGDSYIQAVQKLVQQDLHNRPSGYTPQVIKKVDKLIKRVSDYEDFLDQASDEHFTPENKPSKKGAVKEVYLDMKNPFVYDAGEDSMADIEVTKIIKEAKAKGHDSVIIKNTFDAKNPATDELTDVHIVFGKDQIKTEQPIPPGPQEKIAGRTPEEIQKILSHPITDKQANTIKTTRVLANGKTTTINTSANSEVSNLKMRHKVLEQLINCISKG